MACLCLLLHDKSFFSQFFLIAFTCLVKFSHLCIWTSSTPLILLPFVYLQYHWNHPSGSSLKIQPFFIQSCLVKPALTLKRFNSTLKFLLSLAFLNQDFGNSFISLFSKYDPPKTPCSSISFGLSCGLNSLWRFLSFAKIIFSFF